MKTVYKYTRTAIANGVERYDVDFRWHYGELPEVKIKEYKTFNELWEVGHSSFISLFENHTHKKLFSHKKEKRIRFYVNWAEYYRLTEDNFDSVIITWSPEEIKYNYTIEKLMKELTAEEFIDYCHDHGLNVCPMK